ncbi:response regulator transcription factor [Herbaspirillum rhizosphaerae]|uniref:response regulator transcription factor n=1 Tax=Herbaspirillum rhizosphaerae TaxID=346179 RepID=UPI00067D2F44|nr:response regulator [Herbaspirillum rhizosphaerae]
MHNGEHHHAAQSLIAVIDDDHAVRTALRNLLHSAGYETCSFESAEEFLAGDCLHTAKCAIMDVRLSAMNGFELQQHLTGLQVVLPVIFVSGNASPAERARAIELGAVAFLCKPINADILLTYIKRVVATSGEQE